MTVEIIPIACVNLILIFKGKAYGTFYGYRSRACSTCLFCNYRVKSVAHFIVMTTGVKRVAHIVAI